MKFLNTLENLSLIDKHQRGVLLKKLWIKNRNFLLTLDRLKITSDERNTFNFVHEDSLFKLVIGDKK